MSGFVLVIDDETAVREAVADILELEGIKTLMAANGEIGITLCRENQADIALILLDLSMPGLSGAETLDKLRQIVPDVPIVLSSGYNEDDATGRLAAKNWTSFLQKPYNAIGLIDEVNRWLD